VQKSAGKKIIHKLWARLDRAYFELMQNSLCD